MPSNKSVIRLEDFTSIKELAEHIKYLDENNSAYEEYRHFKQEVTNHKLEVVLENRPWEPDFDCMGINHQARKGNYINHLDCYICDYIHEHMKDGVKLKAPIGSQVNKSHYGCPLPEEFIDSRDLSKKRPYAAFWHSAWLTSYCEVKSMYELSDGGRKWVSEVDMRKETSRCLRNPYLMQEIQRD